MGTTIHTSSVESILQGVAAEVKEFSLQGLVNYVSRRRDRALKLYPIPFSNPKIWGCWFSMTNGVDLLLYEEDTATVHQHHIILHELGHMLLDHPSITIDADEEIDPDKLLALITRATQRSDYHRSEPQEIEAEAVATALRNMLVQRAGYQVITSKIATVPAWNNLASELALDR